MYPPFGPSTLPVIAHPDSSPAGRVEVYLSQKNWSGVYRVLLGCGKFGVRLSETEDTSQTSCFPDEGTMASCTMWGRVLSSSSKLKEIQGLTLLPWAWKSIWSSKAVSQGCQIQAREKYSWRLFFSVLIVVCFESPVVLSRTVRQEFLGARLSQFSLLGTLPRNSPPQPGVPACAVGYCKAETPSGALALTRFFLSNRHWCEPAASVHSHSAVDNTCHQVLKVTRRSPRRALVDGWVQVWMQLATELLQEKISDLQ